MKSTGHFLVCANSDIQVHIIPPHGQNFVLSCSCQETNFEEKLKIWIFYQ